MERARSLPRATQPAVVREDGDGGLKPRPELLHGSLFLLISKLLACSRKSPPWLQGPLQSYHPHLTTRSLSSSRWMALIPSKALAFMAMPPQTSPILSELGS